VDSAAEFDTAFLSHPACAMFEPALCSSLRRLPRFPEPEALFELAQQHALPRGLGFRFTLEDAEKVRERGGFDAFIAAERAIPTRRNSYHDLLGSLVWLHFPALKTALHELQLGGSGPRSQAQNAVTHLDESGLLVVSRKPSIFEAIAGLSWSEVFWERRAELAETTRFLGFGHGLLDSLRCPHPALMGKALFVRVTQAELDLPLAELRPLIDRELASHVPRFLQHPRQLFPLPVLGIPGWTAKQDAAYYEDTRYFRRRKREGAPLPAAWVDLA